MLKFPVFQILNSLSQSYNTIEHNCRSTVLFKIDTRVKMSQIDQYF